jgi:uncharacterized Rmd1/YagE family protein
MNATTDQPTAELTKNRSAGGAAEVLGERARLLEALAQSDTIVARAVFLGERIELRPLTRSDRLGSHPLIVRAQPTGVAVLLRYGVLVFFNTTADGEASLLRQITPLVSGLYEEPETESVTLRRDPARDESIEGGVIYLRGFDVERLQLVAIMLSKSVALAEYEARVAENFERVEPFAVELRTRGRGGRKMKELLQQIGEVLLAEHRMVGRVEVREKPELLWEHAELESLYVRLENEFEIADRSTALERKLALTSQTVSTVLDLLQNRRTLRVEWYIVILIIFEILLSAYEMFGSR